MPHSKATEKPEFTAKCHYTLLLHRCSQKAFLPAPRIIHVPPCLYTASTASTILSELYPNYLLSASKHRCKNIAKKPKDIFLDELCSNCRPSKLRVCKLLRPFELLTPRSGGKLGEKAEVRVMSNDLNTSFDWGVSADEIERVLICQIGKQAQTESKIEDQTEIQLATESFLAESAKTPDNESVIKQLSDSNTSTDTEGQKARWTDICLSVEHGEAAHIEDFSRKTIFSRILSPFVKGEDAPPSEREAAENAGQVAESVEQGMNLAEEGSNKDWIKVKDEPDWDVINDEEIKEKKLWEEDGDCTSVKH